MGDYVDTQMGDRTATRLRGLVFYMYPGPVGRKVTHLYVSIIRLRFLRVRASFSNRVSSWAAGIRPAHH